MLAIIDIDVVVPCFCSMESICRFGSCYDLHQNRLTDCNLYCSYNIAFVVVSAVVAVVVDYCSSALDNHGAC
jgi:hypothetical protein